LGNFYPINNFHTSEFFSLLKTSNFHTFKEWKLGDDLGFSEILSSGYMGLIDKIMKNQPPLSPHSTHLYLVVISHCC